MADLVMTISEQRKGHQINSKEKADMLRETITYLYSKEGRSKSYIGKLLYINRKTIADKIKEWDLPEAEHRRHLTPSSQKFANKNRTRIESMLNNDVSITNIAKELGVPRRFLQSTILPNDKYLCQSYHNYINRRHENAQKREEKLKEKSSRNYDYEYINGEEWRQIKGYERYEVSSLGRIRRFSECHKSYYLIKQEPNKNTERLYVRLKGNDKSKNLQVSRIVAHTFVDGYSEEKCTVNHIDGNCKNNAACNLEWVSQSENNTHAYRELGRPKVRGKRYKFSKIIYKDRYEFRSVAAFARFLKKSETQVRRYLDSPEEHNITLIQ